MKGMLSATDTVQHAGWVTVALAAITAATTILVAVVQARHGKRLARQDETLAIIDRSTNHRPEGTPTLSEESAENKRALSRLEDATTTLARGQERISGTLERIDVKIDKHFTDPHAHQ